MRSLRYWRYRLCLPNGYGRCGKAGFSCNHLHPRLDFFARNQGWPVRYDLAHLGPAFPISSTTRRTGEHQGNHLAGEAIDGAPVGAAHADAHLYLRRVADGWGGGAVSRIHAEILCVDFVVV